MADFTGLYGQPLVANSAPYLDLSTNPNQLFGQLLGYAGQTNANSQGAINTFQNLGSSLNSMFDQYGAGQRAQVNQAFDTTRNNVLGRLAARGFGGSNLAAVGDIGVEKNRQLALGQLNDQLLGQRIGAAQNVAQGLAGAYTNAGNQNLTLTGQMLGLSRGINNTNPQGFGTAGVGGQQIIPNASGGGSGGGGGGGGGSGVDVFANGSYFDLLADQALKNYAADESRFLGTDGHYWTTQQTAYGPVTKRIG